MRFLVLSTHDSFPFLNKPEWKDCLILHSDNWDDWFIWSTQYYLQYFDSEGEKFDIGAVKIGSVHMNNETRRPDLPESFSSLDVEFFSVGQTEDYYTNINALGSSIRDEILDGLRDVAKNPSRIQSLKGNEVFTRSLMRTVPFNVLEGRFTRLARGDARLTKYKFSYAPPEAFSDIPGGTELSFEIIPQSEPPTNIHVLVGRNGVGKTHYLKLIQMALIHKNGPLTGRLNADSSNEDDGLFANLISVSFSAFDPFDELPVPPSEFDGVSFSYVGLKKPDKDDDTKWSTTPKAVAELLEEFVDSLRAIKKAAQIKRWGEAIELLQSDPVFRATDVAGLAEPESFDSQKSWVEFAKSIFSRLSSGHKIVLLTITRLVEDVVERSLILLDEPESHLHPPLLSAFVRTLSNLMIKRNGVAIVATHSPVVLQEVPRSCVWKLWRSGTSTTAERPETETFGENIGVLTREVFGLEVTQSGFHKMISDAASGVTFDAVVDRFEGQLGSEALSITRTLTTNPRDKDE
ncbi:MAG: AAA family ATPase [Pyrinomonadaceae bacterium]